MGSSVVTPYSAVFYATHKCNLDCSYCTQKNPEVFSEEVDTEATMRIFANIRKDVDTLLITGGECLMRGDIEELVRRAKQEIGFRSVLVVTNGVLLDKRKSILPHLNGLIVSLDAMQHDRTEPMSKSAQVPRVLDNLMLAKQTLRPDAITISCVLDLWNLDEAERILAFCQEHGFQFSVQSSQNNGKFPSFQFLEDERYQAFVDKLIAMRKARTARINGTPKLLETLLLRFEEFKCYPTMFPRVYPNGDVFYRARCCARLPATFWKRGRSRSAFDAGASSMARRRSVRTTVSCLGTYCRPTTWKTLGIGGGHDPPSLDALGERSGLRAKREAFANAVDRMGGGVGKVLAKRADVTEAQDVSVVEGELELADRFAIDRRFFDGRVLRLGDVDGHVGLAGDTDRANPADVESRVQLARAAFGDEQEMLAADEQVERFGPRARGVR
ncbi:MAG: radical SAM protein [Bryobacterales bacterium]